MSRPVREDRPARAVEHRAGSKGRPLGAPPDGGEDDMTDPAADDATDIQEVAGTFGSRKRSGAWTVPRTLRLHTRMGSTEFDFTRATFVHGRLDIELQVFGGS